MNYQYKLNTKVFFLLSNIQYTPLFGDVLESEKVVFKFEKRVCNFQKFTLMPSNASLFVSFFITFLNSSWLCSLLLTFGGRFCNAQMYMIYFCGHIQFRVARVGMCRNVIFEAKIFILLFLIIWCYWDFSPFFHILTQSMLFGLINLVSNFPEIFVSHSIK